MRDAVDYAKAERAEAACRAAMLPARVVVTDRVARVTVQSVAAPSFFGTGNREQRRSVARIMRRAARRRQP